MSGQFISFHVSREGFRLVPKEPQRVISFGSSTPSETIDIVPGKVAKMKVRMERIDVKPRSQPMSNSAMKITNSKPENLEPTKDSPRSKATDESTTVTIQGTATNPLGAAIAGATVHLVYENKDQKQTTTDSEEKYSFEHAVQAKSRSVQVFATVPDYGMSWHGKRSIALTERPTSLVKDEQSKSFYQDEPVVMNIRFLPRTSMRGRIRDGERKPVKGARVSIRSFDYLDTEGMMYHHNYREFGSYVMPAHLRTAKTGSDGRFSIEGLPLGTAACVTIAHDDYARRSIYVSMSAKPIDEYTFASIGRISIRNGKQVQSPVMKTRKVSSSPLDFEFIATRSVRIRVVDGEGPPQHDVFTGAGSGDRATGTHAGDKSDAEGLVTLALPPGEYRLSARPPRESRFVSTSESLIITKDNKQESVIDFQIQQGCLLRLKAVDAKTGAPIPKMSFWKEMEDRPGSRTGLNSSPDFVDHPKTGKDGILEVIVKPGVHQIGVGWSDVPDPYRGGTGGREIKCEEGTVVSATFECRAY